MGSFRVRLALLNVVIFGLLQAIVWISVSVAGTAIIRDRFETHLLDRANDLAGSIEALDQGIVDGELTQVAKHLLASVLSNQNYVQLVDGDGKLIWLSLNLRGVRLPTFDINNAAQNGPTIRALDADDLVGLPLADGDVYMVTKRVTSPSNGVYSIQVASDRAIAERAWRSTMQMILIFAVISLLLAAIASWTMTGRYLTPLRSISRQAGDISAKELSRRVSIPYAIDEIAELVRIFNQMLDRLEREFNAQRQFISNVSHELKTPLTILLGEARKHRRRPDPVNEEEDFARLVEEEARAMFGIVEGFLILADTASHVQMKSAMPVNIEDVAVSAIEAVRSNARVKGVRIVMLLSDNAVIDEPVVSGDFDLLRSMVRNLIENAVRHSPPGSSVVVRVETTSDLSAVELIVRDQGPGIPNEHLSRVFELFHQVRSPVTSTGTGGIGLAIVKAVAENHRGTASVVNSNGGGCEFRVRLPLM